MTMAVTSIKPLAVICLLFLASDAGAFASLDAPITAYFHGADAIYLVRVDSLIKASPHDVTVKFIVTNTLKGTPVASLSLAQGLIDLRVGSEFLVVSSESSRKSSGGWSNTVGSEFKGNVGWHDAPITREDNQIYVFSWSPKADKVIGGRPYLTLDHVKELLKQDSAK
jgi:hypothetical protein